MKPTHLRRASMLFLLFTLSLVFTAAADTTADANAFVMPRITSEEALDRELRMTHDLDRRAFILAATAWPDEASTAVLRTTARNRLVTYGQRAIEAASLRFLIAPREYMGEMVSLMIQARERMTDGFPRSFVPAMEMAIWFGDRESRRLAIPECAMLGVQAATMTIIDATYEDPELEELAVFSLGQLGDDRARFWLTGQLDSKDSKRASLAAQAMMQIGGEAAEIVRERATDDNLTTRIAAVEAMLFRPNTLDLSALYGYYGTYPEDDPELRGRVRDIAERLEQLVQEIQNSRSSSPDEDR